MEIKIEHRLTEVEERSKSNQKRIDEIEKRQDNLDAIVGSVKILADREERVENDVKEIKADVKALSTKPAKRWEGFISILISAIVGVIVGFVATQIGL